MADCSASSRARKKGGVEAQRRWRPAPPRRRGALFGLGQDGADFYQRLLGRARPISAPAEGLQQPRARDQRA